MLTNFTIFLGFFLLILRVVTFVSTYIVAHLKRTGEFVNSVRAIIIQESIDLYVTIDYIVSTVFLILFLVVIR